MKDDTAAYVLTQLQQNFSRKFGKESLEAIKPDLMKEPDQAMMNAGDYIILNMASLPSAAKLLEVVQQEGKKIRMAEARQREDEAAREKKAYAEGHTVNSLLSKEKRSAFEQHAILTLKIAQEKGPCQDLADACLMMATTYPHVAEGYRELRREVLEMMHKKNGTMINQKAA